MKRLKHWTVSISSETSKAGTENFIHLLPKDNILDPIQELTTTLKMMLSKLRINNTLKLLTCSMLHIKLITKEILLSLIRHAKLRIKPPKEPSKTSLNRPRDSIKFIKSIFITRNNSDSALLPTLTIMPTMVWSTETLIPFSNKITPITTSFTQMTHRLTKQDQWSEITSTRKELMRVSSKSRSTQRRKGWWRTFSMPSLRTASWARSQSCWTVTIRSLEQMCCLCWTLFIRKRESL